MKNAAQWPRSKGGLRNSGAGRRGGDPHQAHTRRSRCHNHDAFPDLVRCYQSAIV